jgi:hypothetical protein
MHAHARMGARHWRGSDIMHVVTSTSGVGIPNIYRSDLKNTCTPRPHTYVRHTSRGRGDMHAVVCRVREIDRHCGRSPCRLMTDRCIPPSNSAARRRRQRLLYCAWFSIPVSCRRSSSWEWHIFCCSCGWRDRWRTITATYPGPWYSLSSYTRMACIVIMKTLLLQWAACSFSITCVETVTNVLEQRRWNILSEDVDKLRARWNVMNTDIPNGHTFTDEVKIDPQYSSYTRAGRGWRRRRRCRHCCSTIVLLERSWHDQLASCTSLATARSPLK